MVGFEARLIGCNPGLLLAVNGQDVDAVSGQVAANVQAVEETTVVEKVRQDTELVGVGRDRVGVLMPKRLTRKALHKLVLTGTLPLGSFLNEDKTHVLATHEGLLNAFLDICAYRSPAWRNVRQCPKYFRLPGSSRI